MSKDDVISWLYGLSVHGVKLGLRNITELLHRLGDPQESFRTIHVAGSDGKGSTCSMIYSILRSSGIKAGLYTSPHILEFNERISVSGKDISDRQLVKYARIVKDEIEEMRKEGMQCTFFEAATAIAVLHFRDSDVEYAVIEVGMGGRFDATNVIDPDVTVITNISMEHTEYLGSTIEEIAYQKAGIIKEEVPVVTINSGPALEVIRDVAYGLDSDLIMPHTPRLISLSQDSTVMEYDGTEFTIGIPGDYQTVNASMALEAVRCLGDGRITVKTESKGLKNVRWPCRIEKMDGYPLIIDVSHTFEGSRAAFRNIENIYGKVTVVFGILSDKDIEGIAKNLSCIASKVIVTSPQSERAADIDKVFKEVSKHVVDVELIEDVSDAIDRAMSIRGDENVLITGSLFMAEGAMKWLKRTSAGY